MSLKPEPQPRHIAQSGTEGRTANRSSDSYHPRYHSLQQRRSSERSRCTAASTKGTTGRETETPRTERAFRRRHLAAHPRPARTLLPKQTTKRKFRSGKSQHVPFRWRGRIRPGGAEGEEAASLARSQPHPPPSSRAPPRRGEEVAPELPTRASARRNRRRRRRGSGWG